MPDPLKIINHILVTIGEAVVSNIDSRHPSVIQAKTILDNTDYEFQLKGWWFNKIYNFALMPDIEGVVTVPDNCIEFTINKNALQYSAPDAKKRYVQKGTRVFDTVSNTFNIGVQINADLVLRYEYNELPGAAFIYLMHKAAEAAFLDDDGDPGKGQKLEQRTMEAWQQLKAAELKALAINTQDAPIVQALRYRIGQAGAPSNPTYPGGRPY